MISDSQFFVNSCSHIFCAYISLTIALVLAYQAFARRIRLPVLLLLPNKRRRGGKYMIVFTRGACRASRPISVRVRVSDIDIVIPPQYARLLVRFSCHQLVPCAVDDMLFGTGPFFCRSNIISQFVVSIPETRIPYAAKGKRDVTCCTIRISATDFQYFRRKNHVTELG